MNAVCAFESDVEIRLKNHMLAEHEIGEFYHCDDCDVKSKERSVMIRHIETLHGEGYRMCGGNCTDRLYEENSFTCGKCEELLCLICSKTDIGEKSNLDPSLAYCAACARD